MRSILSSKEISGEVLRPAFTRQALAPRIQNSEPSLAFCQADDTTRNARARVAGGLRL